MIAILLMSVALLQAPGRLQPGSGIVTGSVHSESGSAAAGVRVGAMAIDDPSSLVSVSETDANGRYRLTNIPAGRYFIVAGRLDQPTYFPGGTDRAKAATVAVEAAKITAIADFAVPAGSKRAVSAQSNSLQDDPSVTAFRNIAGQKNPETRKKLLLSFQKDFPKSTRLPEAYIELSRVLASQSDFHGARDYAEKAVAAVGRLKASPPPASDQAWSSWIASLEKSAKDNLAWTMQTLAWQQKQLNATILGRR
jgi:hypothetical protein